MPSKKPVKPQKSAAPRRGKRAAPDDARLAAPLDVDAEDEGRLGRIVAIGASLAGLPSVRLLLRGLPAASGAAIVLLIPDAEDAATLASTLAPDASVAIVAMDQVARLKPDQLLVVGGRGAVQLQGETLSRGKSLERPIDAFFRDVASAAKRHAVAVVLAGVGTDGALGAQAIKAEGGICFAEHDSSASPNEMPRAAIAAGAVDAVLAAAQIGPELARVEREMDLVYGGAASAQLDGARAEQEEDTKRLFAILRRARDVDFTHYRPTTIRRRIARRMMLYKMRSLGEYIQHLAERPAEIEALYQDILIKVTHFFRDPVMFEALATRVFPEMLASRTQQAPVRIWVPGCATGEEPYSIAIVLLELLGDLRTSAPIQIFATDVSDTAIDKARAATYFENISLDVSPERLRRFFKKDGKHYQVNKSIRDLCVFARQNVTRDPPFSNLDLISCRNVLIYLEPVLQKKVIPMFHYALRSEGRLVLGRSETITSPPDLFVLVDKQVKMYAKSVGSPRMSFQLSEGGYAIDRAGARVIGVKDTMHGTVDIQREADRIVIGRYSPAGVVIDGDLKILQFRGQTGDYLEPAPGEASFNVLKMAREGLMLDLRAAIERARRTDQSVRKEGVRVRSSGGYREVALEVIPIRDPRGEQQGDVGRRFYLVLFDEPALVQRPQKREAPQRVDRAGDARRLRRLEEELVAAKGYLQAIIEEQEATNEELQSANEEVLSSNEELQSINEELETAKEELQSTNEELTTLNEELEGRNTELSTLNNDLSNLLASVNIAIVMLSRDLRIRRFTPLAERFFNLIPGDLGRPLADIKARFHLPELEELVVDTIERDGYNERDVQDGDGRWYALRTRPYRTAQKKIEGAVICLFDIDVAKREKTR